MKKIILIICFALTTVFVYTEEVDISAIFVVPENITEEENVLLEVEYIFPEGMYQSYNKDLFYFSVKGIEGIILDEIIYPKGEFKDGGTIYFGETILSCIVHLPEDIQSGVYNLSIIAAYQLCNVNGMCYFPKEEEIKLELILNNKR